VPIVLIAPPSPAGVSRNQYSQFNVNANGLILNNSTGRVATSQAGWIAGNPQLGAPARIIVNEVAGAAPSRLLGTIEVAGRRADIVVANPNGITCDGCGFLNTGRASLTTGAPQFDGAGGLRAFDVRRGELTIGGNGLNAANLEQLDLIARGMVFEGEVWATNLAAIAGANHVMYDSLRAAAQPGAGPAPRFAVDVKDLGGMFAGQVYLLATEQGLGVNSSGRMAALQGNLELSAGGDLALKDSYARQDIRLASAGGLHLAGQTKSDGATAIAVAGRMSNAGAIDAGAMLAIDAGAMHNQGEIIQRGKQALTIAVAGQADNDGRIFSNGMLAMRAGALAANRGTMQSAGDMALVAAAIALTDARLTAGGHASLDAANGVATTGTRIEAAGNLFIDSAGAIGNTGGDWRAGGKVALQGGSASNAGGIIAAQDGLTVHTHGGQFDNQSGTLDAGTTLTVESGDLLNRGGRLAAREAIGVTAGVLDNAGGAIGAGASVRLATRALDNTAGEIRGAADLNIDAGDAALTNAGGALRAGKILSIRAGDLSNSAGLVQADGSATIQAASVDNRAGQISAASRIAVATDRIDNAKGMIAAGSAVELAAGGVVVNQGGQIVSDGGVTIAAAALDNRSGVISAAHAARIGLGEGTLDNAGGALRGKTSLVLQSGEIRNAAGMLYSGSALAIDTRGRSLDNSNGGTIFAHGHLDIAGAALNNAGGALASETGAIDIALGGAALDNAGGRLLAAVDVRIAAGDLGNRGGAISGRDVRLATGALDNEGGRIIAARNLDGATQALFNQRGLIYAAGDIGLDTQGRSLVNSDSGDGGIIAGGGLAIASGDLDNRGGVIASGGRQSLTVGGVLDNGAGQAAGGRIVSNADSAISVTSLLNERGSIAALGNIGIVAGAGGEIDIDNRGGKIAAGGIATLQARLVDNGIRNGLAGTIDAGGVNIKAEVVENAGGAVRSAGDALIEADIVDNRDGLISARAHLDMRAIVLNNTAGTLVADASVAVDTAILSPGGVIASAGDVSLAIRGDYENTGTVSAGRNLTIDALNIGNDGILTAGDTLSASAVYNLSNRGEISARKTYLNVTDTLANSGLIDGVDTRIEAGNTDNTGRIYGDVLRINGDAIGNRATGTIAARETLLLGAQTLSNTDGGSILSLGDIVAGARVHPDGTVSGEMLELTNASARIEAARDMTLSAAMLHNRNDGLVTGMKRFVQPVNRTLIQPAGSVQKHDKASLGWDPHHKGGTGRHVLPSEAYPFARFGALPKPLSTTTVCTGASESAEAICTSTSNYGPDDAVWALFGVLPPKLDDLVAPALPPISGGNAAPGCMAASTMPGNEGRFTGGACGRYWEERDLYELTVSQRAGSASAALDASISAFNADVQARAFEVWNEYHVEARNITETTIEATRPGQIFAGNTITLAGSGAKLNDNSEIVAGGAIRSSGGSISNIAAEGMRSVSEVGQVRYRRVEHHGGLWNNKPEYEIQYRPWEPIPDAPAMQTFALPSTRLVEFAGNPTAAIDLASNAGGPVRPGAALAQGVTAGTIAAIAAGAPVAAPDHPAPRNAPVRIRQVDAAGSAQLPARIVSAGLSLELPASRLFALLGRPAARHLVETDPRFTRERAFLNSDY
ncbi:MAG: Polymorphic rane protein Filamentous hemagglutinin/Adhesin, partial [Herminiimonas sp.]|nr:Polymorphic rane protein Filamentous hemagglutinin/Adhesin [Herminiimonas sp.]